MFRILKSDTTVGYDFSYVVKETESPAVYHSLYLFIFLSLQSNFLSQISQFL